MPTKMAALKAQLSNQNHPAGQEEPETPAGRSSPTSTRAPSRDGKVHIGAYLPADFKAGLRLVQAQTGKDVQALVAEAFNELFHKYRVPQVDPK